MKNRYLHVLVMAALVLALSSSGVCQVQATDSGNTIVFSEDDTNSTDQDDADDTDSTESTTEDDSSDSDSSTESSIAENTTDPSDSGEDFIVDGKNFEISEDFSDSDKPKGFKRASVSVHGKTYKGLEGKNLTLLYLKSTDSSDNAGEFYIYKKEGDSVELFKKVGRKKKYCIVQTPDKLINDGLSQVDAKSKDVDFKAYQFPEIKNNFYYIYGTNQKGVTGWYEFDSDKNRIFPANEDLLKAYKSTGAGKNSEKASSEKNAETASDNDKAKSSSKASWFMSNPRALIALLIFIIAVCVVIFINALLFRKSLNDLNEDDPDDEDDESEDSDEEYEEDLEDSDDNDITDLNDLDTDPDDERESGREGNDYAGKDSFQLKSVAGAEKQYEPDSRKEVVYPKDVNFQDSQADQSNAPSDIDDALDHTLSSAMWQDGDDDNFDVIDLNNSL